MGRHRLSSAYFPHSNLRAEQGVKLAKKLIRDNTDRSGSLDNDKFARALLNYRNTPLRDIGRSPAQIVTGRQLRDHLPANPSTNQPNPTQPKPNQQTHQQTNNPTNKPTHPPP